MDTGRLESDMGSNSDELTLLRSANESLRKALENISLIQSAASSNGNVCESNLPSGGDHQNASKEKQVQPMDMNPANLSEDDSSVASDYEELPEIEFLNLGVSSCDQPPPDGVKCYCLKCRLLGKLNSDNEKNDSSDEPLPIVTSEFKYKLLIKNLPPSVTITDVKNWLRKKKINDVIDLIITSKEECNKVAHVCVATEKSYEMLLEKTSATIRGKKINLSVESVMKKRPLNNVKGKNKKIKKS